MIRNLIRSSLGHFPTLAKFLRNSRDFLDQRLPARTTPWGFTLAGHEAMANGSFEIEETKLVRQLLQEVDVLVNLGANVGYYCCHALSLGKQVVAVEPIARNLHYLLKNIHDNGWSKQAEIFPMAVGASNDILNIWGGGTSASLVKGWASIPEDYVTQVPAITLDRLLGEKLQCRRSLILVDIEGAEYMMLQGAQGVLHQNPKPIWMLEISKTEHQPEGITTNPCFEQTFDVFFQTGYKAYSVEGRTENWQDREIKASGVSKTIFQQHNFIFRVFP